MAVKLSHILRFSLRIGLVLLMLLSGIFFVVLVWWWAPDKARHRLFELWSTLLLKACGVKLQVVGSPLRGQAVMWVANHVSWLDVFCLDSVRFATFIAKSEIRSWPLLGWLVKAVGTIFIERQNRRGLLGISQHMHELFAQGRCIGLFPEGTTSDGFNMLRVHSSLLTPALSAGVSIQPVALVYRHRGERSGRAAFVGDQTLIGNFWHLLNESGASVTVHFLEPLQHSELEHLEKAKIAELLREQIRGCLQPSGKDPRETAQP